MRSRRSWRGLALILSVGLALVALLPLAGAGRAQESVGWLVARDAVNLRAEPSADAAVLTVLAPGARVEVLGAAAGDWLPVRYAGQAGYAARAFLGAAPDGAVAPFSLNLPVPFRRQLTDVWCDPAMIQSWYEYVTSESVADGRAFQARTWAWEEANNLGFTLDEWNASPYAVASALHHHMPDRGFNHWKSDDPLAATRAMAWFLANPAYRQPSIALIWRGAHYVLVRGVEAEGDPYLDYPRATIRGVYVMDPNQGSRAWLGQNLYVPIADWTSQYLTPVSYLTPHTGVPGDQWQGKYVTIQPDWRIGPPLDGGRTPADLAAHLASP